MKLNVRYFCWPSTALLLLVLLCPVLAAQSQTQSEKPDTDQKKKALSPEQLIGQFQEKWDDDKWEKKFRGLKYMRATGEAGWQTRMESMQALVATGKTAVPALMKSLNDEKVSTQIFAAQTLSYLAPHTDVAKLTEAFRSAKDPAVRLYLVDTMGMTGKGKDIDWNDLASSERNRDVRKHIGYAKERENSPVEESTIKSLVDWDIKTLNSAKMNEPAPDFKLSTFDGKEYSLKDFKGKKPVVLIFVYGDT